MVPPRASRQDVRRFLERVRALLQSRENFFVIPRRSTLEELACLGMKESDLLEEIKGLSEQDYSSGPESDRDPDYPGEIWVFGKEIDEIEYYIKLKIEAGQVIVISFHEANYCMRHPYR